MGEKPITIEIEANHHLATRHLFTMINSNGAHDVEHGEDPLESPSSNGGGAIMGFKVTDAQFPLILVSATSFVLMIAVVTWEEGMASYAYALSVPVLSLIICIGSILMMKFKDDLYAQYGRHITHVLFMWNFTGACFLTFSSPFTTTGNGYFAAWGCVGTSAMAMGFTKDAFRSRLQGMGPLLGLGAFSAITIIALIDYVGKNAQSYYRSGSIYAMVVSVLTIVFIAGITYFEKTYSGVRWFVRTKVGGLGLFALLWLVLACLCTFSGPFNKTGNGYFASWGGAVCAAFAAFSAWQEMGISPDDVIGFLTPASNADGPTELSATIS